MGADILVVDDEQDIRELVCDILQDEGFHVRQAASSDEALARLSERMPAAVFLDIWLQGSELDGLGILEIIRERYVGIPVIMISGHGTVETAVSAMKLGAYDFIEKPFKEEHLLLLLQRALETRQLRLENESLKQFSSESLKLVGSSPVIQQLRQHIAKVGTTNSRVFIHGLPGSGKELTARLIHQASTRSGMPFVQVSAASLSPDRVEEELFGADTGQHGARRSGFLEQAHGGTLYLDEVGDMPMPVQAKLLRVLQEQRLPQGDQQSGMEIDVRVIASSSRNMLELMQRGQFREDLYYRLNVVPINVPPLNMHRDDIAELCEHFIALSVKQSGLTSRRIGKEAMALLESYHWPGNVRQLRNVVEWLLIMAPGEPETPIRASMLPKELFDATPIAEITGLGPEIMALPLKEARELFERQYLKSQIRRFGGNISKTSAYIGMERSALHRKLKLLELSPEERQGA